MRRAIVAVAIAAGAVAVVPHAVGAPTIQRSPSLGHTKSIPWSDFYPSESSSESSCLRASMPLDQQVSAASTAVFADSRPRVLLHTRVVTFLPAALS